MAHLVGRRELHAVPRRPAVHLGLRAAAEPQKFRPELFDEIEQSRNRGFLLLISTTERQARDMHVQSASPGGVAEVVEFLRFTKHRRPRHFVQMVFKRHRVRDELQTIVQAAVRLDVQVLRVRISDIQQLLGVIAVCAAAVDLKLNAEMTQAFSVEYKVGRVAVFVNNLAVLVPVGRAVSVVVIVPVCAVTPQNAVAICTTDVILIETTFAERIVAVLNSIFGVNPLSAGIADNGKLVCAAFAQPVTPDSEHQLRPCAT